jgi:hypothetical protein
MAGPSGEGAVAAMDEDLEAPLSSGSRDVMIPSAPGVGVLDRQPTKGSTRSR